MSSSWPSLALIALSFGCPPPAAPPRPADAREAAVRLLPLAGPIAAPEAEISAMAWHGETLLVVPQYPDRFGDVIFTIEKQALLDHIDGRATEPIVPGTLRFVTTEAQQTPGYEGFEALAVVDGHAVLTIEASPDGMMGYAIAADFVDEGRTLRLDAKTMVPMKPPVQLRNKSFESLVAVDDGYLAFFEANGRRVNPAPVAWRFTRDLVVRDPVPFPSIEYRITDATPRDAEGCFWTINTYYLGDTHLLADVDHSVEQLVEMRWTGTAVERTSTEPLRLQRLDDRATRNWEGLVRLDDRGFLLASDKFPGTMLAFVEAPHAPREGTAPR
jgi:hypothetical protein